MIMMTMSVVALMLSASLPNTQQEVLEPAAPVSETFASWNIISRSSSTIYMVDVNGVKTSGDLTTAYLARVPSTGDTSDQTHMVSELILRCRANQSKAGEDVYYAADGSVEERVNNDYDFEPIARGSLDDYVKTIVCDGERSTKTFDSVQAFIAAGRPTQ